MISLLPLPIQPESGIRSSHIHSVSWKPHQWRRSDYWSLVRCSADSEKRITLSHYTCTASIPKQPSAFSLLQEERLKSSSLRQKIFHSTPKKYDLWNMSLADNSPSLFLGPDSLKVLVQFWCDSWGRRWGHGFTCWRSPKSVWILKAFTWIHGFSVHQTKYSCSHHSQSNSNDCDSSQQQNPDHIPSQFAFIYMFEQ